MATIYRFEVTVSDVDRGVYETLDLRLALHPSETMRYLLTRTLAYCLCFEEGIAFSKGGLSSPEEAPVSIRDHTGALVAWIDIGAPSAERLHKASKAANRVAVFTTGDFAAIQREAANRPIHRADRIELFSIPRAFVDTLEARVDRNCAFELVRNEGQLYSTIGTTTLEGELATTTLADLLQSIR
ncbi:MAG: YaeQ family protein [Polyangiaceae bacterium]|nr:YaeQ family protein [Polyangiaceae bacterium]